MKNKRFHNHTFQALYHSPADSRIGMRSTVTSPPSMMTTKTPSATTAMSWDAMTTKSFKFSWIYRTHVSTIGTNMIRLFTRSKRAKHWLFCFKTMIFMGMWLVLVSWKFVATTTRNTIGSTLACRLKKLSHSMWSIAIWLASRLESSSPTVSLTSWTTYSTSKQRWWMLRRMV